MIKYILHITFLLIAALSFSQEGFDKKESTWRKEQEKLKYKREKDYKGPDNWIGTDPTSLQDDEYGSTNYSPGSSGTASGSSGSGTSGYGSGNTQYNPQQIQRDRQKKYSGYDRGGGGGTIKKDPKIKRSEPIQSPQSYQKNPPTSQPDASESDSPAISMSFWKILLYIAILVVVLIILYYFMKRYQPPNKSLVVNVENEWNPEVISKTELELKLEAAEEKGDYRECVRIYFTFILKELISKGWIRWKKEKTNHHYVLEMSGKEGVLSFMECVRIYDLVWYGNYNIDQDIFEMLRPTLESYYKSFDPKDE